MNYQTCSRPKKVQKKTFVIPKTLPEITLSLPEGTATASNDNFIMQRTQEKKSLISYKTSV